MIPFLPFHIQLILPIVLVQEKAEEAGVPEEVQGVEEKSIVLQRGKEVTEGNKVAAME